MKRPWFLQKNRVDLSSISEVRRYITEWPRFWATLYIAQILFLIWLIANPTLSITAVCATDAAKDRIANARVTWLIHYWRNACVMTGTHTLRSVYYFKACETVKLKLNLNRNSSEGIVGAKAKIVVLLVAVWQKSKHIDRKINFFKKMFCINKTLTSNNKTVPIFLSTQQKFKRRRF